MKLKQREQPLFGQQSLAKALQTEGVDVYPYFVKTADGYSVKVEMVAHINLLADAIKRMLADPAQALLAGCYCGSLEK